MRIVDVMIVDEVEVLVNVVKGDRTVNVPDGGPEAIRRVAVRVNVEVLVTVVVHSGLVAMGDG